MKFQYTDIIVDTDEWDQLFNLTTDLLSQGYAVQYVEYTEPELPETVYRLRQIDKHRKKQLDPIKFCKCLVTEKKPTK